MAKKFTAEQREQLASKKHFRIGIAHTEHEGKWAHHAWEDYIIIKATATRARFRLADEHEEILTVTAQDLDDDFIRIR